MRSWLFLLGVVALLVLAAVLLPSNTLTGHVIQDPSCKGLGCAEMCDTAAPTCESGMVCCFTHWETGLCDYQENCDRIREYSLYQTLPTYLDSVRQEPRYVTLDWQRFFLPLALVVALIVYLMFKRDDPNYK